MTAIGAAKLGIWKEPAANQFGRVEERPPPHAEEKKKINVAFIVNTGGKTRTTTCEFFLSFTPEEVAQAAPEPETRLSLSANERRHKASSDGLCTICRLNREMAANGPRTANNLDC